MALIGPILRVSPTKSRVFRTCRHNATRETRGHPVPKRFKHAARIARWSKYARPPNLTLGPVCPKRDP